MILFLSLFSIVSAAAVNYCDPQLCSSDETHIGCGNLGKFALDCSADAQLVKITDKEIKLFLDEHNKCRNSTASGRLAGFKSAARMRTLVWDAELAQLAALNVKQCKMKHDQCRSTFKFRDAGQNLYNRKTTGDLETAAIVIPKAVQSWYAESSFATQSDIDKCCNSASGQTIGHFTQVVSDRSGHVGCAISAFTSPSASGLWKVNLVACNYGFTNMDDWNVYQTGKTASGCTSGVNPEFKALCSVNEKSEN